MSSLVFSRVLALVVAVVGAALVLGLTAGAIYSNGEKQLNQIVEVARESITIPTEVTSLQRGQHLASAVAACASCHGQNLAGQVFVDDPLLARIVSPNLTRGRGGVGATRSDEDFARVIRHGVDPSGRVLLVMPSNDYNHFSDADLGAIIAYIRALPPINTALPSSEVHTLGLILFGLGGLPLQPAAAIDHLAPRPASPVAAVSVEYGKYLSDNAGCPSCHGPGLSGGKMPQARPNDVPAANLTSAGLGNWSEADFFKAMRTGIRPDGPPIGTSMPWPYFAQMTDTELRAIWRYLQAVPARKTGTL